jgi:hypothetical protein
MPPAFPHEAVRDLIGIARAMYLVEQDKTRRAELAEIGKKLRDAAELARKVDADTLGGRAAMNRAEEATDRLCGIVAGDVLRLVHAAAGRVKRG